MTLTASRHPSKCFWDLAERPGEAGRGDGQFHWYATFSPWLVNRTLLDVGTGISKIKERMAQWNVTVTTHEACFDCVADLHGPISALPSKRYDIVTCFDVIEHVKAYGELAFDMSRIAKEYVIVTTPGYAVTGNLNPHHWHEFYVDELLQILDATGMVYERGFATTAHRTEHGNTVIDGTEWNRTREELVTREDLHPIGVIYRHRTVPPLP